MNEKIVRGVILGAGLTAGALGGYFFARRKFELLATQEIAEARSFYNASTKEYATPADAVAALIPEVEDVKKAAEALRRYQGDIRELNLPEIDEALEEEEAGIVIRDVLVRDVSIDMEKNVFDQPGPKVVGKETREKGRPYLIEEEDFMQNEREWNQTTLTFYRGDQILVDVRDQPVDSPNQAVGDSNLETFERDDVTIIYVRNENLEMDFEIVVSHGKYSEEVAGFRE